MSTRRIFGSAIFCSWRTGNELVIYITLPICVGVRVRVTEDAQNNRVFSLTWPASMQIYWNKRKRLHMKGTQLPKDWFGKPTWPPYYCCGTPIWPPWRHVKTLYRVLGMGCFSERGDAHITVIPVLPDLLKVWARLLFNLKCLLAMTG